MSSSDKPALEPDAPPAENKGAKAASSASDEEVLLVLRIEERQLMWIALAVLAVFVVINGFAILTGDSSSSQYGHPFPDEGSHDFPPPPGNERSQNSGGQSSTQGFGERGAEDRAPRAEGGSPNNDSMKLVKGEEALARAKAFAADFELSKEDSDALVAVVEQTNTAIEGLDARLADQKIDASAHASEVKREQENQRLEIVRLIGWQQSANLHERLRSNASAEPGGSRPPKSP